jgi:hypothetical protein
LAGLFALASALAAPAADAAFISLSASDPIQLGRLSRNGVPQDWAGDEPFPGLINTTTPYHFHAFSLNVGAYRYIDIEVDGLSTSSFVSAYQSSYHPTNLATGWLGDPGTSADFFGTDPLFFDVVAALNGQLVIVLNESVTNGGLGIANGVNLLITGYSCNDFTCDDGNGLGIGVDLTGRLTSFATVIPEPSTLALLGLPLAALGLRSRRKRVVAVTA